MEVDKYRGLVIYLAKRICRTDRRLELEDIIQQGMVGLSQAHQSYIPEKGSFSSYAYTRIWGTMVDYIRKLDPLSNEMRGRVKSFDKIRHKLTVELGREPTDEEMGRRMKVSQEDLDKIKQAASIEILSLEEFLLPGAQVGTEVSLRLVSRDERPDAVAMKKELAEHVDACLESLTTKERFIINSRYVEEMTLERISLLLSSTIETVRRQSNKAIEKLRKCLRGQGWIL